MFLKVWRKQHNLIVFLVFRSGDLWEHTSHKKSLYYHSRAIVGFPMYCLHFLHISIFYHVHAVGFSSISLSFSYSLTTRRSHSSWVGERPFRGEVSALMSRFPARSRLTGRWNADNHAITYSLVSVLRWHASSPRGPRIPHIHIEWARNSTRRAIFFKYNPGLFSTPKGITRK